MARRVIFLTTDVNARWDLWASQNNYQQYIVLDTSDRNYDALPSSAFPADIIYANSFPLPGDTVVPGEGKNVYVLKSSQTPTRWPTDRISLTYLANQQLGMKLSSQKLFEWWSDIALVRKLRSDQGNYLLPLATAYGFEIKISGLKIPLPDSTLGARDVPNILDVILSGDLQLIQEKTIRWNTTQRELGLYLSLITYQPVPISILGGHYRLISRNRRMIGALMARQLVNNTSFSLELSIGPNVFFSKEGVKDYAGTFREISEEDSLLITIFSTIITMEDFDLPLIKPLLPYLTVEDNPEAWLLLPTLTERGRELILYAFVQKDLLLLWKLSKEDQAIYDRVHQQLGDLNSVATMIFPGVRNYPTAYEYIFEWKTPLPMEDVLRRQRVLEKPPSSWREDRHRIYLRDEDLKAAEEKWGASKIPLPVQAYRDIVGGFFFDAKENPLKEGDIYACKAPKCWSPLINLFPLSRRLGSGLMRLARQPTDPIIRFRVLPAAPGRVYPIVETSECSGIYAHDIIMMMDVSEFDPGEAVVIPDAKETRCYVIENVLATWENALSLYDNQSERVVPSYPRFLGINVEPAIVRSVILTARDRKISLENYPIIVRMAESKAFLDDLYEFIQKYDQLTRAFELVTPDDEIGSIATSTRRDLIAGKWLEAIAVRNGVTPSGYRKYRFIPSTRGSSGTQAFLSCIMTAWIVKEGYGVATVDGERRVWLPNVHSVYEDRDPARPCLSTRIIDDLR